jgi:hypothetical protein
MSNTKLVKGTAVVSVRDFNRTMNEFLVTCINKPNRDSAHEYIVFRCETGRR